MATSKEFIEYICEELNNYYEVRYRKMFGEYMIYINDKPLLLVCDDTVYVKKLKELEELMQDASQKIPYKGAKEHYILDIDDINLSIKVINILLHIIPFPKKRKK